MGLLEKIFPKKYRTPVPDTSKWEPLTAYRAAFTSWRGEIYEFDQVRSAIDTLARNTGKLKIEMPGTAKGKVRTKLKIRPNPYQTWYQFLYRARTIYEMQNNAIIVPILGQYDEIVGLFPVLPSACEVVQTKGGKEYLRYTFANNQKAAIELEKCGIITKHQYKNDIFGDSNSALNGTLGLLDLNKQAIKTAVQESATFRFVARMNNYAKDEDIRAERQRVKEANLKDKDGFLLLFSNLIGEPKQITYTPYTIDEKQLAIINSNIEKYFGVSPEAIKNELTGDKHAAFYEGAIEPFAVQASEVITNMIFTPLEQSTGNLFMLTANRIQFMTNSEKLNVSSAMADRGLMTINEIRTEIWNLAPIEGGDRLIARGEYYFIDPTADPSKQEQEGEDNA